MLFSKTLDKTMQYGYKVPNLFSISTKEVF